MNDKIDLLFQPQFINLSDIWMHLQEELVVVNQMNDFIWQLQTLNAKV